MLLQLITVLVVATAVVVTRSFFFLPKALRRTRRRAVVVVGGDFARSPRMQYHAISLADSGLFEEVVCIGLDFGNTCCEGIQRRLARSRLLDEATRSAGKGVIRLSLMKSQGRSTEGNWIVATVKRVINFVVDFSKLIWEAIETNVGTETEVPIVLVQSPPAVPFVPLIKLLCVLQRVRRGMSTSTVPTKDSICTKVVVDWHNFGFTLLAIDRRPAPIIFLYKFFEQWLCTGHLNLTVSKAMKKVLTGDGVEKKHGFHIPASKVTVIPDTAPAFFAPCSRKSFLEDVVASGAVKPPQWFVEGKEGLVIVSATSWTADDDYTVLVEALKALGSTTPSPIWVVVTGKGETRAVFEQQVEAAGLLTVPTITVTTVYFQSFQHYAMMLGVADVGLSLHRSSSGWDLPMKVVDMFGCGLPVLAIDYPALSELVTSECGWLFTDSKNLESVLKEILSKPNDVAKKRRFVAKYRAEKWDATWKNRVFPLLRAL